MSRYIAIFSSNPSLFLDLAQSLSPKVELHSSGAVVLSVPYRYEESTLNQLMQLSIASGRIDYSAASTRTAALFAARIRPGSVIPRGGEKEFLAPFPIDLFVSSSGEQIDPGILGTLSRWGIHTLGQLAGLPESELIARLGQPGLRLQQLSRGEDLTPFQPYVEELQFEEKQELEWELDSLEPLSFVLGGILDLFCKRLQGRGLATDHLEIELGLTDGSSYERHVKLAFPMRNPKVLLSLVRLKLQSDPPHTAMKTVWVRAHPARPQVFQYSLLEPDAPNPEAFSRTMARMTALVEEKRLGSPVVLDTHRPDAFRVQEFSFYSNRNGKKRSNSNGANFSEDRSRLSLRRIRPPRPIPMRVEEIVACAGPWRSCGEWWACQPMANPETQSDQVWYRDEWDIEKTDGHICRIYWDHNLKKWFLEGVYD